LSSIQALSYFGHPEIAIFLPHMELVMLFSRSVGVATGYGLDGQGIQGRFPAGEKDLSVFQNVKIG
jgi:hypothetical protein